MTPPPRTELDALVVGAGLAGLHQLHRLRELGLRVRAYDAADDVGGTWWWHDHPGARLDTECFVYQIPFSDRLDHDWSWSERFPGGYEVLRWLRFVADRLDLRRDVRLSTRITEARYDDAGWWTVRTDAGETIDTRFLVSCAGVLDVPTVDPPGLADFAGPVLDTSRWPRRAPDLAGRRVGVLGAGASAVQLVPALVDRVGHLTVVAGATGYTLPRSNPMYGWQEREAYKARFAELRATIRDTASGCEYDPVGRALPVPDGTRRPWLGGVADLLADEDVNREASESVRGAMRDRLADPRLADLLVPTDHGFGTRWVALESGWLEALARPDVDVLAAADVRRVRADGLDLTGGVQRLDVLIRAPEFDAGGPAITRIDVRGRDGRCLATDDGDTTLGLAKHGYPNLLTTGMPLAPSAAHGTMSTCLHQQTEWITGAIRDLLADGRTTIEPTADGQASWVAHHRATADATLLAGSTAYTGGVGAYRRRCEQEAAAGYPSFTRG